MCSLSRRLLKRPVTLTDEALPDRDARAVILFTPTLHHPRCPRVKNLLHFPSCPFLSRYPLSLRLLPNNSPFCDRHSCLSGSADLVETETLSVLWSPNLFIFCSIRAHMRGFVVLCTHVLVSSVKPCGTFGACLGLEYFWGPCVTVAVGKGAPHCVPGPLVAFGRHLAMLQYRSLIGLKL